MLIDEDEFSDEFESYEKISKELAQKNYMNYKLEPLDYAEIRKELEKELPILPESIESGQPPAVP